MYWLGTSRWCPCPLCILHFVWICFFLAYTSFLLSSCLFDYVVSAGWCLFFVAWRMCKLLGSYSLPFTLSWTRHYLGKSPHLPIKPMLSFSMTMGLLATDSVISLHRAYYSFTSPFISCYPMGLRVDVPVVPAHFFISLLLRASLAHFLHPYLY